jgi:hypothetical protein
VTSSEAALTITTTPSISGQPTAESACSGGNTTFSVTGSGGALNYAWNRVGWGPGNGWVFTLGGSGSSLEVQSSSGFGSPNIDTNSLSWTLINGAAPTSTAIRYFPAALTNGQQFQIEMQMQNITSGQYIGFGLLNASGNAVWQFGWLGGGPNGFVITDNTGTHTASPSYLTTGIKVLLTLTSSNTYSCSVVTLPSTTNAATTGTFVQFQRQQRQR